MLSAIWPPGAELTFLRAPRLSMCRLSTGSPASLPREAEAFGPRAQCTAKEKGRQEGDSRPTWFCFSLCPDLEGGEGSEQVLCLLPRRGGAAERSSAPVQGVPCQGVLPCWLWACEGPGTGLCPCKLTAAALRWRTTGILTRRGSGFENWRMWVLLLTAMC